MASPFMNAPAKNFPDKLDASLQIQPEAPKPPSRLRRLLPALALIALCGAGYEGWSWWTVGRFLESTDDAYLQSDKVIVAPRIAGVVSEVLVHDNQMVKAGDVIARIDDREYQVSVRLAEAEVEKDKADLRAAEAALAQQIPQIEQARADLANADAGLTFSMQEQARSQDLLARGSGTTQRQQQADADLRQRRANHDKAKAIIDGAEKQVDNLRARALSAKASLAGAEAKLEQARLNLSYATLVAPIDGAIGDRSMRAGQYVAVGANLLTLVPMGRDIYLVANFKETQVGEMAAGQPVSFTVDALGGKIYHGRVTSFTPGTGSQFALLPPENATGNFTKVVQRVPVKIALDADDALLARLRPGLSVNATVRTGAEPGAQAAEAAKP
jgi:membrane fusion protein (multidrug efflux system)